MICPSWELSRPTSSTPCAHLLAELIHLHDARADALLHVLDHALDVQGRNRRLVCQPANLTGNHEESAAVLPRLLRLDGRVDGQQIGLVSHFGDSRHDQVNIARRSLMTDSLELIEPVESTRWRMVLSMPARPDWPAEAMAAVWTATSLTSLTVRVNS